MLPAPVLPLPVVAVTTVAPAAAFVVLPPVIHVPAMPSVVLPAPVCSVHPAPVLPLPVPLWLLLPHRLRLRLWCAPSVVLPAVRGCLRNYCFRCSSLALAIFLSAVATCAVYAAHRTCASAVLPVLSTAPSAASAVSVASAPVSWAQQASIISRATAKKMMHPVAKKVMVPGEKNNTIIDEKTQFLSTGNMQRPVRHFCASLSARAVVPLVAPVIRTATKQHRCSAAAAPIQKCTSACTAVLHQMNASLPAVSVGSLPSVRPTLPVRAKLPGPAPADIDIFAVSLLPWCCCH